MVKKRSRRRGHIAGLTAVLLLAVSACSSHGHASRTAATWTQTAADQDLRDTGAVACPEANYCLAMDDSHPTGITYNHGTWTPKKLDGDAGFSAISCATKSFCMGVEADDFVTFDGSTWSAAQVVNTTELIRMTSVSCISVSFCVAVDTRSASYIYDGTNWSSYVLNTDGRQLNGVSCISSQFCVAVGDNRIYLYDGSAWVQIGDSLDGQPDFAAVSCSSSTACLAVGQAHNDATTGYEASFNGSHWTSGTVSGTDGLISVSCPNNSLCVASSADGHVQISQGGKHEIQTLDKGYEFYVGCSPDGFCLAVEATEGKAQTAQFAATRSSTSSTAGASSATGGAAHGANSGTVYIASSLPSATQPGLVVAIRPDGSQKSISLPGFGPQDTATLTVAPAGTPNVGTVFATSASGSLAEIAPDGTVASVPAANGIGALVVAPAGTPHAGTVYGDSSSGHSILAVAPSRTVTTIPVGPDPRAIAVAPAGTPNAGTIYVANGSENNDTTVTIISPTGQTSSVNVSAPPVDLTIAPAGVPDAGTVFVTTNPSCGDCDGPSNVAVIGLNHSVHVAEVGLNPSPVVVATGTGTNAGDGYLITGSDSINNPATGALEQVTAEGTISTLAPTTVAGRITAVPAGLPTSGTIYARTDGNGLTVVRPDGSTDSLSDGTTSTTQIAVTPAGLSGAGTVYLISGNAGGTATILRPDGSKQTTTFGDAPGLLYFDAPGSPHPGTIYYLTGRQQPRAKLVQTTVDGTSKTMTLPFPAQDLVLAP